MKASFGSCHVRALVGLNRRILGAYSRRTTDALRAVLPLRIVLPRIEALLALNVGKEIQKDALAIRCVGEALTAGSPPGEESCQALLDAGREIDRVFLARIGTFPVGVVIRYEEIEPLRKQRIDRLLVASYRILDAWQSAGGIRGAVRTSYPRAEFESLLFDLFRLYALETRTLSRSVKLPALLVPMREHLAQSLNRIMDDAARRLARELTATVFRTGRN